MKIDFARLSENRADAETFLDLCESIWRGANKFVASAHAEMRALRHPIPTY
jgi:hypothetical protein